MSEQIQNKIEQATSEGKISCEACTEISKELQVSLNEVGETADEMGVKIVKCQLGCF